MDDRQLEFDWSREARRGIVRRSRLPRQYSLREGSRTIKVPGERLKAVLREIDDSLEDPGGGELSFEELMGACHVSSERNLRRALRSLSELGVLTRFQTGVSNGRKNRIFVEIDWPALLSDTRFATSSPPAGGSGAGWAIEIDDRAGSMDGGTRPREQGTRPREQGTRPREQGTRPREQGTRPQGGRVLQDPSPKIKILPPPPLPPQGGGGGVFFQVRGAEAETRAVLAAAGVQRIESAMRIVRSRRLSVGDVTNACALALANRSKLRCVAGAVFSWLSTGDWPARLRSLEEIAQARADAERHRSEEMAASDVDLADSRDLEAELGQRLDAMADAELLALADRAGVQGLFTSRGRSSASVRVVLLDQLAIEMDCVR